jgi:hypothetical protein
VGLNSNILPLHKEGFFYKYIKESKQKMNSNNFKDILEAYSKIYTEQEIEELYKGKHGQSEKEYQAGRSDAGKRISGDENTGPNYYTKGRSRGATPDAPTAPGARPVNTPKLSRDEKEYHQYNKSSAKSRAQYNKVGGSKGLPEEIDIYDLVLEYLCVEGYAENLEDAESIMVYLEPEAVEEIAESGWHRRNPEKIGTSADPDVRMSTKSSVSRNSAAKKSPERTAAERKSDRRVLYNYYGEGGKKTAIERAKKERDAARERRASK